MSTINIIGDLVNDQTSGLQDDDILFAGLDAAFLAYINGLSLSQTQLDFASTAGAAEQDGLVEVQAGLGEVVTSLAFAPMIDAPSGLTTVDGDAITLTTILGGTAVQAMAGGSLVALFWIIPGANNLIADVQMVTFEAIAHPDDLNPDDRVDFSDFLKVRATSYIDETIGDDIFADDDGPQVTLTGNVPTLVVDETTLGSDDSDNFDVSFNIVAGTDGPGATPDAYSLTTPGGASGIFDTATGEEVQLVQVNATTVQGQITGGTVVFVATINPATGSVSLDQQRAVEHANPNTQNEFVSLAADALVVNVVTHDGDNDSATNSQPIGDHLQFFDDAPSITATGQAPTVIDDETALGTNNSADFSTIFDDDGGEDGTASITYSLGLGVGVSGLSDTETGETINLSAVGTTIEGRTAVGGVLAFVISIDGNTGEVTLDQQRALTHPDTTNPNDALQLASAGLVTVNAHIVDGDGDFDDASTNIGLSFTFLDDGPQIVTGFPASDNLGGAVGQHATGAFVYDVGADPNLYALGDTDFLGGLGLTGTIEGGQPITNVQTSLFSENAGSAVFNWGFDYDKDPIQAGVQLGHAAGTLTIDKVGGTYDFAITDAIDGFSFSVLHTNELLAKAPPGNSGHPEIVVTELDTDTPGAPSDGFYVQFTANSLTQNGANSTFGFNATGDGATPADKIYNNGQQITNGLEDWVSATQTTNGVAGDTIQKGELLTLRFFGENILGDVVPGAPGGGTEKLDPTTTADGIAIKFDGIGNSEDLVVVLNLIDANGVETTRAINVQNSDLIKGTVPAPYNTEFSLDNNDALLVLESNDYNAAGETYAVQGVQIMQSANGLTGTAINLNGLTGVNGGSSTTTGLTAWDPTDNDVLKIVDIGFIQTSSGTLDAALNFNLNIVDGDGDTTGLQSININVSNDFNVV